MTRDELLTRFLLTLPPEAAALPRTGLDQAAVLLPLVERDSGLHLLLTRRSSQLRHHGGQVSFPGGRVDPGDAGPVAAALRESAEEIALPAAQIAPLGFLDPFVTVSGFRVIPVVAAVDPDYVARPNPAEVADWFDDPDYPALGNGTYYNTWLNAEDVAPPAGGSGGSIPADPAIPPARFRIHR